MQYVFDPFTLDTRTRQLLSHGAPVHLSPKAFDLLTVLVENRPWALSKADLHARIWPDTFVTDASLATLVNEIRAVLGDSRRQPRFVRTVHGHGYAFCGSARALTVAAGQGPAACCLEHDGRRIPLAAGENVIGRAATAAVHIDLPEVSRRHARITVSSTGVVLEDLGSRNGTFVAGQAVAGQASLSDGDEIRFGSVRFTFRAAADGGTTRTLPRTYL